MKTPTFTLTIVFATLAASAQTPATQIIHITAIQDHIRSKDEPSFSTVLHSKRVTGVIGDKRYSLEEAALMAFHFEVGADYPVLKLTDTGIQIRVTDKKGRQSVERLVVLGVEEVAK